MARRPFMAPPDAQRCVAVAHNLKGGETARCMRRATVGDKCKQHAPKAPYKNLKEYSK